MAEDVREAIEMFLLVGRQAGWSKGTVTAYRWHLTRLAMWLDKRDVTTVDGLDAAPALGVRRLPARPLGPQHLQDPDDRYPELSEDLDRPEDSAARSC